MGGKNAERDQYPSHAPKFAPSPHHESLGHPEVQRSVRFLHLSLKLLEPVIGRSFVPLCVRDADVNVEIFGDAPGKLHATRLWTCMFT